MSKKYRKRNRKIATLLLAGLGAAALGKRNQMSGKETVSDAQKTASQLGSAPKTPTSWITKKVVADNTKKQPVSISRNTGITIGAGGNKVAAQTGSKVPYIRRAADTARLNKIRAFRDADALSMANRTTVPTATIDQRTYSDYPEIKDYMSKGGRAGHKSGGSVKGVGKAKRGFGRAFTKAKK